MSLQPPSIDAWLAELPPDRREVLQRLREQIQAVLPEAEEGFSYGLPAFRLRASPWRASETARATARSTR